jgi:hypothetical protein
MSCDDWDQEYHLTPRGWMTGSSKHYGRVDQKAPRPPDAVETWEQHASQTSGWSREIRMQRLVWHNPAIREEDRKALRSKFQSPFQ